jgi:hypothetical protein
MMKMIKDNDDADDDDDDDMMLMMIMVNDEQQSVKMGLVEKIISCSLALGDVGHLTFSLGLSTNPELHVSISEFSVAMFVREGCDQARFNLYHF